MSWFRKFLSTESLLWLVKSSVLLDLKFWQRNNFSNQKKISFLVKKYYLLFLHLSGFRKYQLGESYTNFEGQKLYYDSPLGLTDYQSILTRHKLLLSMCRLDNPTCFVDVGANVGFFSLLLAKTFPNAKIMSFEPVAKTFQCLSRNLTPFGNVCTKKLAISNFEGTAFMEFDEADSAVSHLTSNTTGQEVKVTTLDKIMAEHDITKVDLLKVDVETFEKHVLEGASTTLANTKYLMVEITMKNNTNYTFAELVSMLYSPKYNFQLLSFRNFNDSGEGAIPLGDFLFENVNFR